LIKKAINDVSDLFSNHHWLFLIKSNIKIINRNQSAFRLPLWNSYFRDVEWSKCIRRKV